MAGGNAGLRNNGVMQQALMYVCRKHVVYVAALTMAA